MRSEKKAKCQIPPKIFGILLYEYLWIPPPTLAKNLQCCTIYLLCPPCVRCIGTSASIYKSCFENCFLDRQTFFCPPRNRHTKKEKIVRWIFLSLSFLQTSPNARFTAAEGEEEKEEEEWGRWASCPRGGQRLVILAQKEKKVHCLFMPCRTDIILTLKCQVFFSFLIFQQKIVGLKKNAQKNKI